MRTREQIARLWCGLRYNHGTWGGDTRRGLDWYQSVTPQGKTETDGQFRNVAQRWNDVVCRCGYEMSHLDYRIYT